MEKYKSYDSIFEIILYIITSLYIIYGIINKSNDYIFNGFCTLVVIALPRIIMKISKIKIPNYLNFIIQIFIFITMFLGKMNRFYFKFEWWDLFLHLVSGGVVFLVAYVVFMVQNNYEIKNVKPILIVTYTFLFSIAMTACWEMWEFAGDQLFNFDSQGGSLLDTMEDIIAGSVGPLIMIPILLAFLKGKKNILFGSLTKFMKENNKSLKDE